MGFNSEKKKEYEGSALEAFMQAQGREICTGCYCCSLVEDEEGCDNCGGLGEVLNDCFEDSCCCLDPESEHGYSVCEWCEGRPRIVCLGNCDEDGNHSKEPLSA